MKKLIMMALALVAGASSFAQQRLVTSTDSVSYAGGMAITNGLVPFLLQQNVDTTLMADFVRGFMEAVKVGDDPKQKAYMVGMNIAQQVNERMLPGIKKEFEGTPDSIITSLFYRGFADAMLKDTTHFTQAAAESYFTAKQQADKAIREEKLYGANRDAGRKFLEDNAKQPDVVTLPSGLQYKVLVQGDGEVPLKTDKVLVNYEGRLIDGTVFDASAKHGDQPSEFTPEQVIKGWTEALTMMPVGSKWQLFIPYELAYGAREAGQIQPYSTLIFDVELVGISRPETENPAPAPKKGKSSKKTKK